MKTEKLEVVDQTSTALAVPQAEALAFSAADIDIPRINVLQKMSQIEGPTGSIMLDKEFVLAKPEQKINAIVVAAQKKWKEDISFDSDEIPRFANTQAEADALAASSEYSILEFADIILLIPEYDGCDPDAFAYPIGDKNYAIGKITVQKDAYRCTFKRLATFQSFNRNIPIATRFWSFSSELMSKGKYSWYVPSLSITKEDAPAEAVEFATSLFN